MAEKVPPEVLESVVVDNVKTVAGQPASLANLALQNAVAHNQAMNAILVALTTKAAETLLATSPGESDVAAQMMAIKASQTTPPVTVPPPAGG